MIYSHKKNPRSSYVIFLIKNSSKERMLKMSERFPRPTYFKLHLGLVRWIYLTFKSIVFTQKGFLL